MVAQWKAGWGPEGSIEGGALIVDEDQPFVGVVDIVPKSERAVELVYGVAPPFRGRGIATRAARLVAVWALADAGFDRVELRIAADHEASRCVAERAGVRVPPAIVQRPYSSRRRNQRPVSFRPPGARSSHWYMPQSPSSPRA